MNKRFVSIMCFMLTIILIAEPVTAFPVSEGYAGSLLYRNAHDSRSDTETISVSGDSLSDNTVSGDSVSDNTVSGDSVSDNTISDNTVSDDSVSDNTISRNAADESSDLAADQTAGFSLQAATTVVKNI